MNETLKKPEKYRKRYMKNHKMLCVLLDNEKDKDIISWLGCRYLNHMNQRRKKMDKDLLNDLDDAIKHCEEKAQELYLNCDDYMCAREHEQLAEWLKELKSFKEGQKSRKDFIETVLSVAVTFELDELDVALYLVEREIKLDDFKYNDDRYNYFKEFFEVHGLLKGVENG